MSPVLWVTTVGLLCALWCVLAWRFGPQRAIACQVLVACLVPTWAKIYLDQDQYLWLDCRTAATVFGLGAYCFHPKATFPWRLGWLDAAMISLVGIHICSDIVNSGWSFGLIARVYGEWCVPYLAGRLALQNGDDLRFVAPWGACVAVILALGSLTEGITGEHSWELLYGPREDDGIMRDQPRWGLTRAWGCCAHPIYFGFVQVMLLPWLLRAWHRTQPDMSSRRRRPSRGARVLPLLGLAGVFCTGSRTALLAYLIVPLMGLFYFVPKLRIPMFCLGLVLVLVGITQRDQLTELVTRWGETVNKARKIEVAGEKELVTGTSTRWQLVQIYWPAMVRASWLGFGTENVTGFPVRVPVGAIDPRTLKELPYIDNQYVLMVLRFGWLGGVAFTAALMLASAAWFQRSSLSISSSSATSFYVGGMILAVAAGLLTVWMPQDIGFPLLWWMGAGSSTPSNRKLETRGHDI